MYFQIKKSKTCWDTLYDKVIIIPEMIPRFWEYVLGKTKKHLKNAMKLLRHKVMMIDICCIDENSKLEQ